jgi:hypothetical protein
MNPEQRQAVLQAYLLQQQQQKLIKQQQQMPSGYSNRLNEQQSMQQSHQNQFVSNRLPVNIDFIKSQNLNQLNQQRKQQILMAQK